MFENLPSTPYKWHFLAYCLTLIGCGATITGLGPLLPFFSDQYGKEATEYSYLFLARAGGYLFGSLLSKMWQSIFTFHQIILYSSILMTIMLFLFSFVPELPLKTCFILVTGIMNAQLDVFINMSIIEEEKDNRLDFWLQVSHGAFGIGGLIGPFFVYLFGFQSFIAIGVIFLCVSPAYIFLKSPCIEKQEKSEKLIHQGKGILEEKRISIIPKLLLCFMFLMMIGEETAFGGWVSSYAVLAQISNKQFATLYGSIFWLSMTIFRFLFSFIPGSPSKKLIWLILGTIFTAVTSLILILYVNGEIGIFYSSVLFGVMLSVVFPLLLSTPKQYNYDLTPSQNSDFMICAALGQGIIAVVTGYLMNFFGINMLFYSILGINVFLLISFFLVVHFLDKQTKTDANIKDQGISNISIQSQKQEIKIQDNV